MKLLVTEIPCETVRIGSRSTDTKKLKGYKEHWGNAYIIQQRQKGEICKLKKNEALVMLGGKGRK